MCVPHRAGKVFMPAAKLKMLEREHPDGLKGHVYSRDLTEDKVSLIEDNIMRFGFDNITAQVKDAALFYPEDCGRADVVFADLPCSGLGVIGRKADIKYNMSPEQMAELAGLQRKILPVAGQYVAPGGTLMYSTCTVNPAENIENARWFEENYPFSLVESRQYLPGIDDCDGFFIAKFKKENPQ